MEERQTDRSEAESKETKETKVETKQKKMRWAFAKLENKIFSRYQMTTTTNNNSNNKSQARLASCLCATGFDGGRGELEELKLDHNISNGTLPSSLLFLVQLRSSLLFLVQLRSSLLFLVQLRSSLLFLGPVEIVFAVFGPVESGRPGVRSRNLRGQFRVESHH